ncbi:hypothetical protein Golomagni_08086 [Golovinomyces magnicellulatus]|nr:hypothetical protein Golomagni_08086 [Golovinomyces magnicellulatus]
MTSPLVAWTRLVRYQSRGDDSTVKFGEPIIGKDQVDQIATLAGAGELKVRVFRGNNPLDAKLDGNRVETVLRLLGPLQSKDVSIVRCIGLNYTTHILETGRPLPECPTVFTKPNFAVADHNEDIPIPPIAQSQCDYEGELVVLIGRDAKDVKEDEALDYVAAYTVGNDVSARDWQREANKAGPVPQWTFSKSFDKYAPLGPCLVAAHELGLADGLALKTFVNGELRQSTNTTDLHFGVAKLIAFCSQGQTLAKGSIIMTGTPGGVGLFMKPPCFLKDGDYVEVEIDRIGRLSNRIKFE